MSKTITLESDLEKTVKDLNEISKKIDTVSKQLVILRHKFRISSNPEFRAEIKKDWDKMQKKMERLEIKRRGIIEQKNEIEFKNRWKGWK
jgi:predicted metallo-beta-lactamase superfamily hydrolase